MVPMARITFKAVLDWFMETGATKWHIAVQASQFDVKNYGPLVEPGTGMLTLNISANATRNFNTFEDHFSFKSRINGVEVFLEIPYSAVFMAMDPTTGIPNAFPYFEDHGDMEPEDEQLALEVPAREELMALLDSMKNNPVISGKSKTSNSFVGINANTSNIVRVDFDKKGNINLTGKGEMNVSTPTTVQERVTHRRWTVIEGGKGKTEAETMPFIDHVYRAKRDRREALTADRFILSNEMKHVPEIRSDGSEGKSTYFPDLDVGNCYFVSKPIQRPSWMTVHQGGKA